jgi:hypothetical protein
VLADGTVAYAEVTGTPTNSATATSIAGGSNGTIPYQSAADTTAMLAAGTAGQLLQTNGAAAPTWVTPAVGGLTLGTPVASTSGTSIDFTGLPAGVKTIIVSFNNVSTSSSDNMLLQLGDAGGLKTTGYLSNSSSFPGGSIVQANSTAGIIIASPAPTQNRSGSIVFTLESSAANTWAAQGVLCLTQVTNTVSAVAGRVSLSGVLTQIRLTTTGGTNTFDLGEVNISYQ